MELNAEMILVSPLGKRIRFKENNGLFYDIDYTHFINSAYQNRGKLIMGYRSHTFTLNMSSRLRSVKALLYNNTICTNEDIEAIKCGRIVLATIDDIVFRRIVEFSKAEIDTIIALLTNCYSQQNVIEYCQLQSIKVQSLNNLSNNGVVITCMTSLDKRSISSNIKYCTEMVLRSVSVKLGGMRVMSNKNTFVIYLTLKRYRG